MFQLSIISKRSRKSHCQQNDKIKLTDDMMISWTTCNKSVTPSRTALWMMLQMRRGNSGHKLCSTLKSLTGNGSRLTNITAPSV